MIINLFIVIFDVLVHGISTRVKMMISNDMMSREWELGKSFNLSTIMSYVDNNIVNSVLKIKLIV